jgi:periplasmic copper chaperone A
MPRAPSIQSSRRIHALMVGAIGCMTAGAAALAGEPALTVSEAWVPVTEKTGADVPLLLTVHNDTHVADALLRANCPVANFSERHTVDRGEGAPAMRSVSSIPIAAGGTTVLKPDGYHIMLLQIRQPLAAGDHFTCAIAFQKAGTIETEVNVR